MPTNGREVQLKSFGKLDKAFENFRLKRQLRYINKAFAIAQGQGKDAGLAFLDRRQIRTPTAIKYLFEANFAKDERSWLEFLNAWGRTADLPNIQLAEGEGPLFGRLKFERSAPIASPDLVTIIIPCFNAEKDLEQAVRSIQEQTWQNIEIIAVNDNSTDGTGEVLERLAAKDERLKVLHNLVNVGPYASKNRALALAKGRFVTGHDSDDIAFPNRLELQLRSLASHPGAKATIGYMLRMSTDGKFAPTQRRPKLTFDGFSKLCQISMMCETKTLRGRFGAWDSVRFGADSELIERMEAVLGDEFVRDKRVVMLCQDRAGSLTNDPETGTMGGLSPERRSYTKSYKAWHASARPQELKLPLLHHPRKFAAPDKMVVSEEDFFRNTAHDIR